MSGCGLYDMNEASIPKGMQGAKKAHQKRKQKIEAEAQNNPRTINGLEGEKEPQADLKCSQYETKQEITTCQQS